MKKVFKNSIIIHEEKHYIIYIEYAGSIPFSIHTITYIEATTPPTKPYWRLYDWDCVANDGDAEDLIIYNSGSGGDYKKISAPQWVDGYKGKYWLREDISLKGNVKNGKRLKCPKVIKSKWKEKSSINPFNIGEIVHNIEYCDRCEHWSTEWCQEHKYQDEKGNMRYIDNNEPAE